MVLTITSHGSYLERQAATSFIRLAITFPHVRGRQREGKLADEDEESEKLHCLPLENAEQVTESGRSRMLDSKV